MLLAIARPGRARAFGREVRIEHARQVFGFDADATVTHEEPDGFPHGGCFDLEVGEADALTAAPPQRGGVVRILRVRCAARSAVDDDGRRRRSGLMRRTCSDEARVACRHRRNNACDEDRRSRTGWDARNRDVVHDPVVSRQPPRPRRSAPVDFPRLTCSFDSVRSDP